MTTCRTSRKAIKISRREAPSEHQFSTLFDIFGRNQEKSFHFDVHFVVYSRPVDSRWFRMDSTAERKSRTSTNDRTTNNGTMSERARASNEQQSAVSRVMPKLQLLFGRFQSQNLNRKEMPKQRQNKISKRKQRKFSKVHESISKYLITEWMWRVAKNSSTAAAFDVWRPEKATKEKPKIVHQNEKIQWKCTAMTACILFVRFLCCGARGRFNSFWRFGRHLECVDMR